MALYVPAGRRRRNTIILAIAALVLGVVLGAVVGRATAPSFETQVVDAQNSGQTFAAALRVLPLEYQKVYDANGNDGSGAQDIITRSLANYDKTIKAAPWIGAEDRASADSAIDVIRQAPSTSPTPAAFETSVNDAAAQIESFFGIAPTAAPGD